MKSINSVDKEVIDHLRKIRFIGPFPDQVDVLLTSGQNALDEARLVDETLTRADLARILKDSHILVFRDVNHYWDWKQERRAEKKKVHAA